VLQKITVDSGWCHPRESAARISLTNLTKVNAGGSGRTELSAISDRTSDVSLLSAPYIYKRAPNMTYCLFVRGE
jgi:hypothetical protein